MKLINQNLQIKLEEIKFSPSLHSTHQEQGRRSDEAVVAMVAASVTDAGHGGGRGCSG